MVKSVTGSLYAQWIARKKASRIPPTYHDGRPTIPPEGGIVTITAVSFEALALEKPLRFAPPMLALAQNPRAFDYQWHLIEYVFDVADPAKFDPFDSGFSNDEMRVLRRYVGTAEKLAGTTMLSEQDEALTVSFDNTIGEERFETVRSAPDIESGFVAILRQFYLSNDDASFATVQRMLLEHVSAAQDGAADGRLAELQCWAHAVRTTRRQSLRKSVFLRLIDEGKMSATPEEVEHFPDREPPHTLIDRFLYTEHSHWDAERAKALEARPEDPFRDATERFDFIDAAIGLSHLFIGHAELVRHAAGTDLAVE